MRKIIGLFFVLTPLFAFSQRLHLNLFGGFTNYQGDLQEKVFTLEQSNGAFGLGAKYDLTPRLAIRSGIMYGKASADDQKNSKPDLQLRNLRFQSKLFEGHVMAEYTFFDLQQQRFSPYAFAGVALFHFDPYTTDTLGNRFYLKPLSTEGQGLDVYPNRKPYQLTQFAIPFGGGLKLRLTDNVVIGYEVGVRKLWTDYLDDVSTSYPDEAALLAARGAKAVELSYRSGELKNGNPAFPVEGTLRGSARQKDWYYFQGISISIGLRTGKAFFGEGRSSLECPRDVR